MPLDPTQRQTIVGLIQEGTGRNEIARAVGVSPSTVSNVAKREGLSFERSDATVAATAAASMDARGRRLALGARMLSDLEAARQRLAKEGTSRGFLAAAQGLDALVRAYNNIAKLDGGDANEVDDAKSLIGRISLHIQAIADASDWGPDGPPDSQAYLAGTDNTERTER